MAKQKVAEGAADALISKHLSEIPEIDAIYMVTENGGVIHVYSVVSQYQSRIYPKLLKKESLIESGWPQNLFEFHVRAHQGREPREAVPIGAKQVFLR